MKTDKDALIAKLVRERNDLQSQVKILNEINTLKPIIITLDEAINMNDQTHYQIPQPQIIRNASFYFDFKREKLTHRMPNIVCLCGSTRFGDVFAAANAHETSFGNIVLSVGVIREPDAEKKRELDELHKRKIDLADEILVLNVGGYIGDSTRGEIEYARVTNKGIRYWEPIESPSVNP